MDLGWQRTREREREIYIRSSHTYQESTTAEARSPSPNRIDHERIRKPGEGNGDMGKTGQVEQVVLMQHAPRWDTQMNDPYSAKPQLAELANTTLRRMVDESRHSRRIMVGVHTGLQVDGKANTDMMTNNGDNWRSRNVKLGKFDGVHYYSRQGQEALTASMLEVLRQAGLVRQARAPAPRVDSQWKVVGRGPRGAAPAPAPFNIPLHNRFVGN